MPICTARCTRLHSNYEASASVCYVCVSYVCAHTRSSLTSGDSMNFSLAPYYVM